MILLRKYFAVFKNYKSIKTKLSSFSFDEEQEKHILNLISDDSFIKQFSNKVKLIDFPLDIIKYFILNEHTVNCLENTKSFLFGYKKKENSFFIEWKFVEFI